MTTASESIKLQIGFGIKDKDTFKLVKAYYKDLGLNNLDEQIKHAKEILIQSMKNGIKLETKEELEEQKEKLKLSELKKFANEDNLTAMQEAIVLLNKQEDTFTATRKILVDRVLELHSANKMLNEKIVANQLQTQADNKEVKDQLNRVIKLLGNK